MRRDRQTAWAATHESGTSWVQLPGRKRLLRFTERDVAALEALLPLMRRPATAPQTSPCEVLEVSVGLPKRQRKQPVIDSVLSPEALQRVVAAVRADRVKTLAEIVAQRPRA